MDLASACRTGRRLAALIFRDVVIVEQHAGYVTDDLGTRVEQWTPIYGGSDGSPGLVQANIRYPQTADSAGRPVIVAHYVAKVPAEVALQPRTRYRVRVLSSADPANVGVYEGRLAESGESNGLAICRRLHLTRS